MKKLICLLVMLVACGGSSDDRFEGLIWTSGRGISRLEQGGTQPERILVSTGMGGYLALAGEHVYWTNPESHSIMRATRSGDTLDEIVRDTQERPTGLALDLQNNRMYWTSASTDGETASVQRATLSGEQQEAVVEGLQIADEDEGIGAIALDIANDNIYWVNGNTIQAAKINGSNLRVLITAEGLITGMTIDLINDRLYWAQANASHIFRANLEGGNVEEVTETNVLPGARGLAINPTGPTLYWIGSSFESSPDKDGVIMRADVLTQTVEEVATELQEPLSLALDLDAGRIYFNDGELNTIQSAGLTGGDIDEHVTSPVARPTALAIDETRERVYWTDRDKKLLARADIDGEGLRVILAEGLQRPSALAIDTDAEWLYWGDAELGEIKRATFAGKDVEHISESPAPSGLVIDTLAGKLYWTDAELGTIQRSDLDGRNRETLVSGLSRPEDIAWDSENGWLYWIDSGTDLLQRSNRNGDAVETLAEVDDPSALTVDVEGESLYWSESETGRIMRATLDGANPTIVATDVSPTDVAFVR